MTSPGHSSDEDFLGSLGISLDTDLTADADTHASVTGIYAQDPHIRLDVGETSLVEIPIEIFDNNNPVGAIISLSHLNYLRHFDIGRSSHKELLGALAERWWDTTNTFHFSWGELTMTPTDFSVISGIPFGTRAIELYDDWRTEISPDRMVELIGIDLPRIVGSSSSTPVLNVSRRGLSLQAPDIYARYRQGEKEKFNPSILKSLENLAHLEEYDWAGAILSRMYDDMCDLSRGHRKLNGTYYFWETWAFEYFPYTRPELIRADLGLGLVPSAWRWYRSNLHTIRPKKSLKDLRAFFDTCTLEQVEVGAMTARLQSWIQADPHFQRSDALSRRRVVLSHAVLRRYYLGERVDHQIRGCRCVPYSPPEDMRASK
ncbi:hypothetical protein JCGZ_07838 [Jatropha curcas]|uniref:Aminotransferase-like plant mobile domain-containing protein n=1 Tax=Jatropha curcas TaxID=180498 RepID=A0A067KRL0_JATCU|nr:hypothetical protein JCGZ_07838 [Jatropha curcas]